MQKLISFAKSDNPLEPPPLVRFDPAVNKALTFAAAYGFIEPQKDGKYKLTEKGKNYADQIKLVDDLLVAEKSDLQELSKKLTEERIEQILDNWRNSNVKD